MPYPKRSSPSLNNQILSDNGSFAQGTANSQFDDMLARSSDVVLRRLRGHIWCRGGSTTPNARVEFGIIQETESATPTPADFLDPKKNLWSQQCVASRDTVEEWDNPAFLHFDLSLGLKIELDKRLFFSINNLDTVTNFAAFIVRLFWSLI